MDNRKQTVSKAISRTGPGRIPVVNHFTGENGDTSEWGFGWEHLENGLLMGQPRYPVIQDWSRLETFVPPLASQEGRFAAARDSMAKYGPDRYYKANFSLSGFAILTMLRGFENIMADLYLERKNLNKLCDIVFGFENEVIKLAAEHGFSAIGLADDWGGQSSLLISPDLWREIFKPRYQVQIELAHRLGLTVYLHSCGYIFDIIEDLVEIGLDILNPGQPDVNGVARMGERFGGKICFACPVSYQTTGLTGSLSDIEAQIADYVKYLGSYSGGLIGIIPEDSKALGLDREKLEFMERAFQSYT